MSGPLRRCAATFAAIACRCAFVAALGAVTVTEASAHFYNNMGDYNLARRRLCYEVSEEMANNTNWRSWVRQAFDNWNAVSSKTGWSFRPCAPGERPNIRIGFADSTKDGTSASSEFGAGEGSRSNEEFHIYILRKVSGLDAKGKVSGGLDGWGEKGATTLDPILVIMHEITHAMRLDHKPADGWSTGDLEKPVPVGMHGTKPSTDDFTQASTAAGTGKLKPSVKAYPLPSCYKDNDARQKDIEALRKLRKEARERYAEAEEITTPPPQDTGENDGKYQVRVQEFKERNKDAYPAALEKQKQALSDIEYYDSRIQQAIGTKLCGEGETPTYSSRLRVTDEPTPSGNDGFYVGIGGGSRNTVCDNWSTVRVESTPGVDDRIGEDPDACFTAAVRVSLYAGYSWRFAGRWLAGIEADIGYANGNKTRAGIPGTIGSIVSPAGSLNDSVNVKEDWDGSVRGRFGYYAGPNTTLYMTTGLAWQHLQATITCGGGTGICGSAGLTPFSASNSSTLLGWTLGAGAETQLWGPWLARAEYRYSDYGTYTATYGTRNTLGITSDIKLRTNTVLLGITARFAP